jgi:hypothetical protein
MWDIGMILTRHATTVSPACAMVMELRRTTPQHGRFTAEVRLERALACPCTCGIGHSDSEATSLTFSKEKEPQHGEQPAAVDPV